MRKKRPRGCSTLETWLAAGGVITHIPRGETREIDPEEHRKMWGVLGGTAGLASAKRAEAFFKSKRKVK